MNRGESFFVSWSGGKDSCLALHRALGAGGRPAYLFTMLTEDGERSHSHGLPREVILAQADSLGLECVFRSATWDGYEAAFLDGLRDLARLGATSGVFGDIDIPRHREWVERVCSAAGVRPSEPLWQTERRRLLAEFIGAGFSAIIVAVRDGRLDPALLGRTLDMKLVGELEAAGVDASGELGEYHTVVTDGPLFERGLRLEHRENVLRDGVWFLDVAVAGG